MVSPLRKILIEALKESALIPQENLDRAIEIHKKQGGNLGHILLKKGFIKESWETPYEFKDRISQQFPDSSTNVACLTQSFCKLRFAHEVPGKEFEKKNEENLIKLRALVKLVP